MPAASPNVFTAEPESADHLAPNSSAITLYAELLLNIRTVTLFASLRTAHSGETRAVLSSDCQTITVSHEGESATIRLPIKAKGGGNASLMLPADPRSKVLTLRLQIEELNGSELFSGGQAEGRKANLVPWDGASLNKMKGVKVLCKSCQTPVLADGKVSEWRDLPNENWAEMMDFWHCHKPDEHHLHDHSQSETISKKGYSAATRLEAAPGLGFVHLTSLLFKEQDCDGVQGAKKAASVPLHGQRRRYKHPRRTVSLHFTPPRNPPPQGRRVASAVSGEPGRFTAFPRDPWDWRDKIWLHLTSSTPEQPQPLVCKHCSHALGTVDESASGWRLWKWSIDITSSFSKPKANNYNLQKWISARLLFLIENQGVRKFHVRPDIPDTCTPTRSLLIWVFTPDLLFSSSVASPAPARQDPTRAIKIFWKPQTWSPPQPGEPESASIEDVVFPGEVFDGLESALRSSQALLPMNARGFQGWEVGLLERFDVDEVGDV